VKQRRLLGLDFETYYCSKSGYTLRKMDPPSYILDPRFEMTLCSVKIDDNPAFIVDGPDFPAFLQALGDPDDYILYGHNLMFDACLAAWRYGFVAGFNICTLALSRQTIAKDLRRLDLDSVGRHLGLRPKGGTIHKVNGMTRAMIIAAGLWQEYQEYCLGDIEIAHGVLHRLLPLVPFEELVAADVALRMAVQPSLHLDRQMLWDYYVEVCQKKEQLIAHATAGVGMTKADLMSNEKFAVLLQSLGVDPPTKVSPTTGLETWAFAKTDQGMKDLLDHADPVVQSVVAARLGVKSTIEETRALRFYNIAGLHWPVDGDVGKFPVPLKVSGAHTHRFSGDWKLNGQNLKRNVPRLGEKGKSKLRWSVMVKDGYKIVVADEKQVEARMTATFCGQWDLVDQFARGDDPYSIMATAIFKRTITKANEAERFCGKTLVLSAQYGVGAPKFRLSIKHLAMEQAGLVIDLSMEEAEEYIRVYRSQTQAITNMREYLQSVVIPMMTSLSCDFMVGPIRILHERIELPGGLCLYYKNLHQIVSKDTGRFEWMFEYNGFWKRLYGGKLLENIIQALAQIVVKQAMARLYPLFAPYDIHMALQAHDELVVVTPDCNVDYTVYHLTNEMKRTVPWLPSLPVDVDVSDPATRYGEAK